MSNTPVLGPELRTFRRRFCLMIGTREGMSHDDRFQMRGVRSKEMKNVESGSGCESIPRTSIKKARSSHLVVVRTFHPSTLEEASESL